MRSKRDSGGRGSPAQPSKPSAAFSLFVLLCGLLILGLGAYTYAEESVRLDNRVEVTAEVTETSIEEENGRGREGYVPVVTFSYTFEGTEYTSDRISPGQSQPHYSDRARAESELSTFSVGETVTAYVDPAAPGEAFLRKERSGYGVGSLGIGLAISLVAGGRLYLARGQSGDHEGVQ